MSGRKRAEEEEEKEEKGGRIRGRSRRQLEIWLAKRGQDVAEN